jgi:heme/copper-type cytochrome/quinol oxidase subunit 3
MKERIVLDVSTLPTGGFGPRTTPWWGTLAFIGIEGAGFTLAVGMYLYLVYVNGQWPLNAQPPNHWPGTILTLLLLASLWPNARADANAYGSIVWFILGLHTTHLLTDVGDTIVLTVLMFTRHATERRFSDVGDNAFYWYFVVGSWLLLYGLIYWAPRLGIGG